ncbi:hypothetical protein [Actinoallomurus sp. CA-150999]|uniref:hypothetical protein n=1 Tax=Actinoallomurus sp. CA-150999 TaxID=3239887 RepID=UPI003D8DC75B
MASSPAWREPDPWHAPATYWFWHRLPTPAEIREQVAQMARAGFRSFQIQARLSFPRQEYLSEDYLAACRLAADEAAGHRMIIGVYDEYNWLSGHAGGRTVEGHDELRERHLFWSTAQLTDAGTDVECTVDDIHPTDVEYLLDPGMHWVFENGEVRWDEWELVAALAHPAGDVTDEAQICDLTQSARIGSAGADGCTVVVPRDALPTGSTAVTVFVAARCATSRMINYLLPEAAERYTDVGYAPYAEAFGPHWGSTVKYAFFDQPHACFFRWRQHHGHVGSSLMYTPELGRRYEAEHDAPFRRSLLALVRDIGPMTPARRCDFFETYSTLGIDGFFGTLARWCRQHGIALSGHEVLGHVSSWDPTGTIITDDPRTNFGTDYFGLDRWRDHTAVDARNTDPQLSAKFGDSVARANGRSGCLVEQYFGSTATGSHFAAGQWELTLRDLRAQTIRHHLLGARQLLTHAFWQTDGDDREEMFTNPRFDFAPGVNFEPWFPYHRAFAEESGRLSVFLDDTEPQCEIAVVYPLRSSWAGGPAHPYGEHTAFWTEHLARKGYGYHLVDERDVRAAAVEDGCMAIGGRRYRGVVLPGVEVVRDGSTVDVLARFVDAGGTLLASGPLPGATQAGGVDATLAARMAGLCDAATMSYWPEPPSARQVEVVLRPLRARHAVVEVDDPMGSADSGETVWQYAGRDAAGTRLALFNDADHPRTVAVRPSSTPAEVTRWRPESGAIEPLRTTDGASLTLSLAPWELVCLSLRDGTTPVPGDLVLAEGWTLRAAGPEIPIRVDRGWELQGLAEFSGIGEYRLTFTIPAGDLAWPDWELILPVVDTSAEIELNRTPLGRYGWGPIRRAVPPGLLRGQGNDLRVHVASTAANRYYAGTSQRATPAPCGLGAAPLLRPNLEGAS